MLLVYHLNLIPETVTPGRTYLGYSSAWLQNVKQRDEKQQADRLEADKREQVNQAEQAAQTVKIAQDAAKAASDKASRRAMQRSVNDAIKAAQYQALIDLKYELIANQEMQMLACQLQLENENDALIALLMAT